MKKVEVILKEFVKKCSKELNLSGIIQFGSSTYSKTFQDIDLLFLSNKKILPTEEILKLINIIKFFEQKYKEVVFDFSGLVRKRKGSYSITTLFLGREEFNIKYNPNDLFLFRSIKEDKNKKILFGEDIFKKFEFHLNNRHLFEMLVLELKWALRKCLDDLDYQNEALYHLFKTFLRAMLINKGSFKKEELLEKFEENFGNEINLPKNSKKIINKNICEKDMKEILKFVEECLGWLVK